MTKVEEIRQTIEKLTPRERAELNALLQNWTEDDWDRQMATDSTPGGKLDKLRQQAEAVTLQVSDAAANFLANEARTELESGVAQVHESPTAFAASITKPLRWPVAEA
ncbi:MAG: hypothetical protein WCS70_08320 [Verrucomicrobiota bacterium]